VEEINQLILFVYAQSDASRVSDHQIKRKTN